MLSCVFVEAGEDILEWKALPGWLAFSFLTHRHTLFVDSSRVFPVGHTHTQSGSVDSFWQKVFWSKLTCRRRLVPLSHPLVNAAIINRRISSFTLQISFRFFLTLLNVFLQSYSSYKTLSYYYKYTFCPRCQPLNVPSVLQETLQQLIVMPLPNILHIAKDPISGNTLLRTRHEEKLFVL